jgi:GMP synthase-like glutamine amidotransferase
MLAVTMARTGSSPQPDNHPAIKPTVIVTHGDHKRAGIARERLVAAGCPILDWEWTPAGQPMTPPAALDDIAGIISMGGIQSATRVAEDPFLSAEVALMRDALEHQLPVLGMCLGGQLLAVAVGGRVRPMGHMYFGWPQLTLHDDAAADPLFSALPSGLQALKWHEDWIEAPPGAVVLGDTGNVTPGTALYRVGSNAWGSQMHLEADIPMVIGSWMASPSGVANLEAAGYDVDAVREETARRLEVQMEAARPVFDRFAQLVSGQRLWLTASTLLPSGSSTNAA